MKRTFGLAQRIFLGFGLQLLLIVGIYAVAMTQSTEFMENNLVSDMLREELEMSVQELNYHEELQLPASMRIYSDDPRLDPIPEQFKKLPEGFTEIISDDSSFVYRLQAGPYSYILFRDQYDFERSERIYDFVILLCSLIVLVLGAFFAWWWVKRRVIKPVQDLSDQVRAIAATRTYQPLQMNFADDEVGELARICDKALKRFHEALIRERLFTADISHELRTPLTIIQTSAELLEMDKSGRRSDLIEKIQQGCHSLKDLLNIFVNLARNTAFEAQESDSVHDTLDSVIAYYKPMAEEKKLKLNFKVKETCPGFYSPVIISTIAGNLIKNALLYTKEGEVTVTETATGFEISDTGEGIDSSLKDKIFMPYTRGSNAEPGSGMGLSIVKRLCDRFGWEIHLLESSEGSHFRVILTQSKQIERLDQSINKEANKVVARRS